MSASTGIDTVLQIGGLDRRNFRIRIFSAKEQSEIEEMKEKSL